MRSLVRSLQLRKARVEAEITALQAELARLNKAIEALVAGDLFDALRDHAETQRRAAGTLKQMAYTVLSEAEGSLTAQQILERIREDFGQTIERTSMSPQLSRLGQDGVLLRDGNLWAINHSRRTLSDMKYLIPRGQTLV